MEDSLNKSSGDNLIDLKLNEDLNVSPDTDSSEQGLLVSDSFKQEDPKSKQKGNPPSSEIPKKTVPKVISKVLPKVEPKVEASEGLLDNIGSQIHNETEGVQPKIINKDLSYAAKELNQQIGYVSDLSNLDRQVADAQSNWKQAGNAIARVALKILPEVASQLANALDIEDYLNSDDEVGNWVAKAVTKGQQSIDKEFPIYRENPNKPLDITDPAYIFQSFESLATSIGGFAGAGFITAGLIDFATLRGAKALSTLGKLAQGVETGGELSATAQRIRSGVNTVAQAAMLNQAESVGIGVDTYNISYKRALEKLQADPSNIEKSKEELSNKAKFIASNDASSAIAFNRITFLLNLSSANLFFKSPVSTRLLLDKGSLLGTGKRVAIEGFEEGLEENINDQAQNQALDKNYSFMDGLKYSFTAKGLESSILGMIGGVGNTVLTEAGKFIPNQDNNIYRETYVNEYDKAKRSGLTEEEADVKAQQIAIEKAGTNKSSISEKQKHNQRYVKQQDNQVSYNERLTNDNISDAILNLSNTADITELHKELDNSIKSGDKVKSDVLESILVGRMAQNAFDTGTTEGLIGLFDGYANLTHEQATDRNMYKKGDENTPNYYKTKAKDVKDRIEKLENIYNTSKKYLNNQEVYDLQERKLALDNTLEKNYKAINAKFAEAEKTYKDDKIKHPSFNKTYVDLESPSGFDINKVVPAFRQTDEYKDIKNLNNTSKDLLKLKEEYQKTINEITSKKYQENLKDVILKHRETEKREENNTKKEKAVNETKKTNLDKIKALKEELVDKFSNSTVDTNELREKNLPIVENEGQTESTTSKPKDINTESAKDTPRFVNFSKYDVQVDNVLNNLKNNLSSGERTTEENYKEASDIYNKMSSAKEGVLSSYPLKAKEYNQDIDTLKNLLEDLKVDLDIKNNNVIKLKQNQQQLVNSLNGEEEDSSDNTTDASPKTNIDFAKSKKESDLMFSVLNDMQNLGIDINDFKSILTSFEQNTSKDDVVRAFTKLKGLYIASTGNDVDGTYEDLMYTDKEKNQLVNDFDFVRKFSIPEDRYISELDPTTKDVINLHKELAKLSDTNVDDTALGYEIYNDSVSNLLAYLSKKYELKFTEKQSETGKPYIMVTKEDIDNFMNPNLDERVLNPDFIKVGDKIKLVPLKSVVLEDGTIFNTDTLKEEDKISKIPIGIEINGEVIKGLYLHNTDWINMTNTDLTANQVIKEQNKSNLVRQIIINNGGIETSITHKTPGVPIVNTDDGLHTVLEQTPNVEIGISKIGTIYSSEQKETKVSNIDNIKEGQQVIIIPFGKSKIALPVSRAKLTTNYINSITTAVSLYLDGKETDLTKELKTYGYDILNSKGLENYLHNFINVSNSLNAKTFEGFQDRIKGVDDAVGIISMVNSSLMFGRGTGIRVNNISKNKYNDELGKPLSDKDERINTDLQTLSKHLSSTYVNINLNSLGKEIKIPIINEEGKIEIEHNNYNDFAKANMYSKYMSIKVDDVDVYTIQGKISYDIDSIIKNSKSEELVDSVNEGSKEEIILNEANKLVTEIVNKGKKEKNFKPITKEDRKNKIDYDLLFNDMFKDISKVLNVNEKDIKNTKDILKEYLKEIHPDKVKGEFNKELSNIFTIAMINVANENNIEKLKELYFKYKDILNNYKYNNPENNKPKQKSETIILPSGKTFNPDDVNIDDFSPLTLEDKVNYNLKSFDILSSDKAKEIFAKGEKNNWDLDKILTELQIPKEQKELILNNGKTNLDDIVTDLLSNYSYTVEINTSISKNHTKGILDEESYNNLSIEKQKEYDDEFLNKPTQHYSNLTVPGGTNYTENEIATSAITPSIKGHAQFSTDNGIGWFRSDDKAKNIEDTNALEDKLQNAWNNGELEYGTRPSGGTFVKDANSIESSKIRRILEVQSDLFQKGRNKENLDQNRIERKSPNVNEINFPPGDTDKILQNTNENQFLQLLNKDNNWVTFFVKSIIQDSAKKGYEKVLFPSGNTAAKVEGHETVQGFIDNKESRINELIRRKNSKQEELLSTNVIESDKNILQRELKGIKNEVQQLEKEIEDAKAGKLKISSIANFYEETIFNVLKKQGYNPTTISDEYGNGWNEIELTPETLSTINLSPITEENHDYLLENSSFIKGLSIGTQTSIIKTIANDIYNEFLENTDKSSFVFDVKKQVDLAIQGFDLIKNNYINKEDARAEFVANQVDIIIENKEKILNSVRAILTPKIKRVSNVNYNDEVEVENTLENEEQENIKIFSDKSEYIIDPRTKLSEEVKQFLEGVVQRKVIDLGEVKDYVPITNPLGLNNFISSDVVFNDIMSLSAKSNSNNGFNSKSNYIDERFNSKMLTDVPSYVRNFVINLAKNIDSKPYLFGIIQKVLSAKPHLQNAIVSTFNKAHTHHIFLQSSYNAIDKKWSITKNVAASRSVSALIKTQWLNNISYSDIVSNNDKGKVINKEAIDKFKTDYNNLASGKEILSPKSLNNLLNQIGITIPLPLFNVLNSGKFKEDNKEQTLLQSFNLSNGMFKNIYNRVMQFDSSNSDALTLDGNNVFDETGFTSLAKLVGRYTDNLFNSNFKNGNGDTVYGFSNDRYVISRQIDLKTDINLLSRLSTSVFSTGSEWLKGLLDTSDDIPRINRNSYMYQFFEYYTSDSLKTKNNALGKTINELSADELEKYSFGLFMNNGKYAGKGLSKVPIITVLYPTMEEKSNMFGLQVPGKHYELEEGKLKNQDVKDLVRQLFYPEISRIRAFNQNPNRVNVKEYKQGGHMFLMFPALNYIHDLYEGRELNEDESVKEFGILKQTFNAIEENLLEKQLVNYFRSEAIKRKDNWIKYKILGGEETKGNLHLNYIDENYARNFDTNNLKQVIYNYNINSIVANVNIQQLFLGDVVSYTKIKKGTSKNDFLRIASNTSDNETKRLAVDNASANEILHEPDETFNLLVSNDVITESKVLPYLKELWEGHRLYNNVIDAYSNINSTDAQELTTLSEHVNMLFKEGKITEQQKNSVLEEYENTGRISNQNKQLILQPYKLRYGNNINRNGEDLRLNIKSSSFPLIKQLTENTDLDGLRIHMEENNIHRLAFASAVKIGQPLELVTLFDDNGQFIKPNNIELGLIRNVPRKGHGNQQENPYNEDTNQVIDGSQQSKEIFTNILHIEGFKHPISGEDVNAKELSRLYHNTYNKLFKSKYEDLVKKLDYNEETGSIKNLNYLQNELKKEGINRNYNTNDIEGLELNKSDTNFNVSLWLNASGIKIESLLSSIVDNKVRKRLFRGKSLIMASGVGSKVQTLNTIDKSNVIPIGNWDGTLKSSYNDNGEMTYAEVLAPFKFWDNNNKALKLQDFLNSDGTLDLTRLPQELLETFGYRIPTSGINLMTTIKIVGFLPNTKDVAYGDILIAPDDFIAQMGLDFDVDKLYAHMYNTYYNNSTNSLEKITDSILEKRRTLINIINTERESLKGITDKVLKQEKAAQLDYLSNRDLFRMKDLDINNAYLENVLLDIHKSVLNNPNKEIQQARTKTLSFGDLPNLLERFDIKPINKYFTPISNIHQQDKYLSARAGKAAVGVFSLDMVLNSSVQHVETPMEFLDTDGKNKKSFKINLFGQENEPINNIKTIKGDRFKSDVIEAFMTSALDNGNEQILGKLNVNNETFDFVRATVASGYDENTIVTILMQPIILDYVEKKQLNQKFNINTKTKTNLAYVSLEDAQDIIINPTSDKNIDTDLQKAVFTAFNRLSEKGKELKTVESAINSDSSGVGKNIFYSLEKARQIVGLPNLVSITNVDKLIGDYLYLSDMTSDDLTINMLKEEGYVLYNGTFIKPNSLGGFAGVYSTLLNAELWNNYFPYNNEKFKNITEYSLRGKTNLKDTLSDKAKQNQQISENYKSLLASNTYHLFDDFESVFDARQSLLYDTENNQSLGSIISQLKEENKKDIKKGYSNLLLDRLVINRGKQTSNDGKLPTTIEYYKAGEVEMDEQQVIHSFIDMIVNNKVIGNFNGEELTTRTLTNKLILQQVINGSIQRSTQFIKFVPFKYLQKLRYYDNLENTNNLFDDSASVEIAKRLRTQTVQHYPEQYYDKDIEEIVTPFIQGNKIVGIDNPNIGYPETIVTKSIGDRYNIYKYNAETNDYYKIDNLGFNGVLEYDISKEIGKSNIYINQVEEGNNQNKNINSTINKTLSWNELQNLEVYSSKGINTMRTKVGNPNENFGNIYTGTNIQGLIQKSSIQEAVQSYIDWLDGKIDTNIKQEKRNWINKQINEGKLDNKVFLYMKEKGNYYSHADALKDKVNQKNSNNQLDLFNNEYIPPISDSASFLNIDKDRTQDSSPLVYNTEAKDLVKTFNLDDNSLSIEDKYRLILNEVKDNTNNPILSYFSDKLQDVVSYLSETPLRIDTNLKAKGLTETSLILGEPISIRINPNNIKNSQEMGEVLIEEMTHAILKAELGKETSEFTRNINSIREEIKKDLITKYGQEKYDSMVSKVKQRLPLEKSIEANLMYSVYNNDEFVAAAIKNKSFQEYLNNSEATYTTKSLWQKFISAIKSLLVKLGVKEDSNLESVLHETLNLFDKVNKSLHNQLNTPKFIRTIEYLNNKFNLVDDYSNVLTKGNADEIAKFVNSTIVNVNATVNDNKVLLNYKTNNTSLSVNTDEFTQFGNSGELVRYIESLDLRVNKLKENIRKAKENNDLHKAELLQLDLDKEQLKREEIIEVDSAVQLANKAGQDLQTIETILKRPMGSEDIIYADYIINFWEDAKRFIFTPEMNENDTLSSIYGNIESKARNLGNKLLLIKKNYLNNFTKDYINTSKNIDEMFEDYKDINWAQETGRDISTYDNDLLTASWAALKEADIKAKDESNELLERHDEKLKQIIPILKSFNNKEIFEPFMQKTNRGKRTHQLITPYNTAYYSEKYKLLKAVNYERNASNMNKYATWLKDNSINTDLTNLFPQDDNITNETEKLRNELKSKVGEGKYNYWFKSQEKKIKQYNNSRKHAIQQIVDDFELKDDNAINDNQKAFERYQSWVRRNSPYYLEELTHKNTQFANANYNFNSQNYYEVLSVDEKHLDKNFSIIENNKVLLDYYYEVKNIFEELRKYIPNYQIQDFLYGGIPFIEKSIIELYKGKGMELSFKPIMEALVKSVQSSFGDNSSTTYDFSTKDTLKQMRVPLINNNNKEINNYIEQKKIEYLLKNKEQASKEKIKEFREDIIDEISKRNSFDLGKITKMFTTFVLSHKHKARVEDTIKIINSVMASYQETKRRPDGAPEVNSVSGIIERKDVSKSFLNTKESFNNYVGNIFYNEIKKEEGKGSKIYTPKERADSNTVNQLLKSIETEFNNGLIEEALYKNIKLELEEQLKDLGKHRVASKYGYNILKAIQLKIMGYNFLGGIGNITFGWVANQIEAAGGEIYNTQDLRNAYRLVSHSILKNYTFNTVETDTAKKIRSIMDKYDILKDASKELYTDSVKNDLNKKVKWLAPFNTNQRGEYINQAVVMIALFKNTKVTTNKGETNLYEALDNNGNWNSEYGEKPEKLIVKTRIKLDQLIKRLHGNYDNMSPLSIKKTFTGNALSQFKTFIFENIADRFQVERPDKVLGVTVKGRYRSVATVFKSTSLSNFAGSVLKGILKNYSLGLYKGETFNNLTYKDGTSIREIDAVNMRKVAMEATIAINTYIVIALLRSVLGGNDDDDDNNIYNLLFNQGVRLRTDLVMYVNPIEGRNIFKNIIPAFSIIDDTVKWMIAVEKAATGNDEIKSGVNSGDSRLRRTTIKNIPFINSVQGVIDNSNQMFDSNR